ncbi:hypothetical protein GMRT_14505 [Giardia muris]|uniref:Uncharacterized protein n=1 Tax=Giardia muris TaxID=5742 RepID=A0A4Z1STK7_GIAMU|nr:hypothetical protein GMRT_14505 [Giardia muris]|eukprot:TNJ29256.1 hypothetical protein GMRT_14505 [Giardia muris]
MTSAIFHNDWAFGNDHPVTGSRGRAKPVIAPKGRSRSNVQGTLRLSTTGSGCHTNTGRRAPRSLSNSVGSVMGNKSNRLLLSSTNTGKSSRVDPGHNDMSSMVGLFGLHANCGTNENFVEDPESFQDFGQYYSSLLNTALNANSPEAVEATEACNYYTGLSDSDALQLRQLVKQKIAMENAYDEPHVIRFLTSVYYSNQHLNRVGLTELIEDMGAAYVVSDPLKLVREKNKKKGLNIYGEPLDTTTPMTKSGPDPVKRSHPQGKPTTTSQATSMDYNLEAEAVSVGISALNDATSASGSRIGCNPSAMSTSISVTPRVGEEETRLDEAMKTDQVQILRETTRSQEVTERQQLQQRRLEHLKELQRRQAEEVEALLRMPLPRLSFAPEQSLPPQSDIDLERDALLDQVSARSVGTSPKPSKSLADLPAPGLLVPNDLSGISMAIPHSNAGESIVSYVGDGDIAEPYVIGRFIDPY